MSTLFLIFHGRFPSEKAASLFAAKSVEAFAHEGKRVVLLVPRRKVTGDARAFYRLTQPVEIVYLPILDLFEMKAPLGLAFWVSICTFSLAVRKYLKQHAVKNDIIYSNETLPLWLVSKDFPRTVYEMHDFPESKLGLFKQFLERVGKVVIHNLWKTREAVTRFALDSSRVLMEPNAVDAEAFNPPHAMIEARKLLNLPSDARIAVYTGHLYGWKGIDTLLEAATLLPDILFVFVGGTPEDIARYQAKHTAPNLRWIGFRPHEEIPLWQRAADVAVLPNTAKEAISSHYTSPMKLYEYMASGTPIIASRIPSVEEIADDTMLWFATPDDPRAFADAIMDVLAHPNEAKARAERAMCAIAAHTWDARARRILDFIER